jgi:hypothetical protein
MIDVFAEGSINKPINSMGGAALVIKDTNSRIKYPGLRSHRQTIQDRLYRSFLAVPQALCRISHSHRGFSPVESL